MRWKKNISRLLSVFFILSCLWFVTPTDGDYFVNADSYEYAMFPNGRVYVSQVAYGSYSHSNKNATDIVPQGDVVAPFSGTIRYRDNSYGFVWFESDNEVYWADGTRGKMCVGFMHDNDISDLPVGRHINQGQAFYQAGTKSPKDNVTGAHVHIIIYRGAFNSGLTNGYGSKGNAYIYDAFYLSANTTIARSGYSSNLWRRISSSISPSTPSNTWIRSNCSTATTSTEVTLSWGANNAASYWIHIWRNGQDYFSQTAGSLTSWTRTFPEGVYTVYVEPSNSSGTGPLASVDFTVSDAPQMNTSIADVTVGTIGTQLFTGLPIVPELSLQYQNYTLLEGRDYTVYYSDNISVGQATVTITGMGYFQGSRSVHFNIIDCVEILNTEMHMSNLIPAYELTVSYRITNASSVERTYYAHPSDENGLHRIPFGQPWVLGSDQFYPLAPNESVEDTVTFYFQRPRTTIRFEYRGDIFDVNPDDWDMGTALDYHYDGCSDDEGPEITDLSIMNISPDGFDVSITVSDPSGLGYIDRTRLATVTDPNGNIQYYNPHAYTSDGRIVYHVDGVGYGTYHNLVYAYDVYQNWTQYEFDVEVWDVPDQVPTTIPTTAPTTTSTMAPTISPTTDPTITTTPTGNPTVVPQTSSDQGNDIVNNPTSVGVNGFVERLYTVALGRNADPVGQQQWVDTITSGQNSGADVARGFLYSTEFLNKNCSNEEFVQTLYRTFFGREADEGGLSAWVNVLNNGTSRQDVIEGFINSTEWANLCLFYGIASGGTGVPNVEAEPNQQTIDFCTRLYTTCLNRNADQNGLMAWARQLANRRDSGSGAARGFFFSSEFIGQNVSNGEYVTRLYRTFMGREPDQAGYDAWVAQLDEGVSREVVFEGFAQSPEFTRICADYGIVR